MGIQFYHYDPLSRVESTSNLKKGKSVYSVAGEADRIEGYHDHIQNPQKPVILFGVSFSEVVKMAEIYAEKTLDSQGRKVKQKDFIMFAGVISAPADMSLEIWNIFKEAIIYWLIKKWGVNLKSIIEHIDEYYEPDPENGIKPNTIRRHIHFSGVPSIGTRFWEIHPGLIAKRAADEAYGITKKPDDMCDKCFVKFKKKGRKDGDIAYRKAMSKEQDAFYEDVTEKFGLSRHGPKRLRLSREEIIKRDNEKRIKQSNMIKLNTLEDEIASMKTEAEKKLTEAENKLTEAVAIKVEAEGIIAEAISIKDEAMNKKIEVDTLKIKVEEKEIEADKRERKLDQREIEIENKAKRNNNFFARVEEAQKKTMKLIQNKLSESEVGRRILNWIWPKFNKSQQIQTTNQMLEKQRGHKKPQ